MDWRKILCLAFLAMFILNIRTVFAWYNPSWLYRKAVNISNSGSSLTDYQILVAADTASLISAGRMKADCSDIRFVDSDDATALSYWIESGCNSASTKIWVKVPSISSGSKTIYMYYGNSIIGSESNGAATFVLFDDFDDGSLDTTNRWNAGAGTPTESGGILTLNSAGERIYSKSRYGINTALRFRANYPAAGSWIGYETAGYGTAPFALVDYDATYGFVAYNYVSAAKTTALGAFTGSYHTYDIIRNSTTNIYNVNNILKATHTTQLSSNNLYMTLVAYAGTTFTVDWIALRKYSSPEPTTSIITEHSIRLYINSLPSDVNRTLVKTCGCGTNTTCNCTLSYDTSGSTTDLYAKAETWSDMLLSNSSWILIYNISEARNVFLKGWLDAADCASFRGWACSQFDYSKPLEVRFYRDGTSVTGVYVGNTTANLLREQAVCNECSSYCYHGFDYTTPEIMKDNTPHTIYAYAVNISTGELSDLLGSPKSLTCPSAPYFSDFSYTGHANYFNVFWNVTYGTKVNISCIFDCDPRTQYCTLAQKCTPYPVVQYSGSGGCTVLNPPYNYTRKNKIVCKVSNSTNAEAYRWYPANSE